MLFSTSSGISKICIYVVSRALEVASAQLAKDYATTYSRPPISSLWADSVAGHPRSLGRAGEGPGGTFDNRG
jgi:hypothetical protein